MKNTLSETLKAQLMDISQTPLPDLPVPSKEVLQKQIEFLDRDELYQDPYWPKWSAPWWSFLLYLEMDCLDEIPTKHFERFLDLVESTYIKNFPLTESELPEDCDPYREILCFCAAGSLVKLLCTLGLDPFKRFPFLKDFYLNFQMQDGGYNCDEEAYSKEVPKSSVISTLVMLEPLASYPQILSNSAELLKRGIEGLSQRRFIYSLSEPGRIIDTQWLIPAFPRYYHYDLLRVFEFLKQCEKQSISISYLAMEKPLRLLCDRFEGLEFSGRGVVDEEDSTLDLIKNEWKMGPVQPLPPLLDFVYDSGYDKNWCTRRFIRLCGELTWTFPAGSEVPQN